MVVVVVVVVAAAVAAVAAVAILHNIISLKSVFLSMPCLSCMPYLDEGRVRG